MNRLTSRLRDQTSDGENLSVVSLSRARTVATLLDASVRVPGTRFRFGLDPVFGLVPVLGDSVVFLGSLYIVVTGALLGASRWVVAKMLLLVCLDWVLGSIPLLGTLIDAVLKVNKRNVAMLEAHLNSDESSTATEG